MAEDFFNLDMGSALKQPVYSIVIPVYNEEGSLKPLLSEILSVMAAFQKPYEIIFVNDASNDGTSVILGEFKRNLGPDMIRIVDLTERHGQTLAMRKGFNTVRGQLAVTMDADLQNDPADIPKMITRLKEGGFDCVCGWRKARQDTFLKAILSKTGNRVQRIFTKTSIHDISCTLRVYKSECLSAIPLNWEGQHRFIPLCLSLQGYKVGEIVSHHRLRQYGNSKYSHKRIWKVMKDFFKILKSKGKE